MSTFCAALLDVLVATVWQGALVMLVAAALLAAFGRRVNAATRTVVLQSALAAILVLPLITVLPHIAHRTIAVGGHGLARAIFHSAHGSGWTLAPLSNIDLAIGDRPIFVLAIVWFGGVALHGIRIITGARALSLLVRRSVHLTERDGVGIYGSRSVNVPLAFGFVHPFVLVPMRLWDCPNEGFEHIVFHEIAHVKRHDAWARACELAMAAVLFFNPIAILAMRSIALEREAACDDWAVAQSHDLDAYIRSLASFAVHRASAHAGTPCGASAFHGATLVRLRRLEDHRRNGSTTLSPYALGGLTFMLITMTLSLASLAPAIAFTSHAGPSSVHVAASTDGCTKEARYTGGPPPNVDASIPGGLLTKLRVNVSAEGKVTGTTLLKPSGNATFDRAVIVSATDGKFSPQMAGCKPVAGSYIFVAKTGP